jgi:cation transport regulator ChaB
MAGEIRVRVEDAGAAPLPEVGDNFRIWRGRDVGVAVSSREERAIKALYAQIKNIVAREDAYFEVDVATGRATRQRDDDSDMIAVDLLAYEELHPLLNDLAAALSKSKRSQYSRAPIASAAAVYGDATKGKRRNDATKEHFGSHVAEARAAAAAYEASRASESRLTRWFATYSGRPDHQRIGAQRAEALPLRTPRAQNGASEEERSALATFYEEYDRRDTYAMAVFYGSEKQEDESESQYADRIRREVIESAFPGPNEAERQYAAQIGAMCIRSRLEYMDYCKEHRIEEAPPSFEEALVRIAKGEEGVSHPVIDALPDDLRAALAPQDGE